MTRCFHRFHARCLADHWLVSWRREQEARASAALGGAAREWLAQLGERIYHARPGESAAGATVLCPECRGPLAWADLPQLHARLAPAEREGARGARGEACLLYTSPSPRD